MSNDSDIFFANATTNATTIAPLPQFSQTLGYVAIIVVALLFGSNNLPIKKFTTGNGIFYQWVLCSGIWQTGLIATAVRGFPPFVPLAMLGGFVWCTGNLMCVPAINLIGLAKSVLLWGSFNLMMGWASSRFGWFGLNEQLPRVPWMNYFGVVLCLVSACMYLLIKTTGNDTKEDNLKAEPSALKIQTTEFTDDENINKKQEELPMGGRFASLQRYKDRAMKNPYAVTVIGSFLACAAGLFFGLTFIPVIYIKDNYSNASSNSLDHVFSHYTGIYISSTFYFLLYCAFSKNSPVVFPKVVLPGFVSGLMWGIACIGWFIANDALSESVSYPIATTLPGIISTMWGMLFREVKGIRNFVILFLAIAIGMSGSIVTGLSK